MKRCPWRLTSGQFSLLMSLNRPEPPSITAVANLMAMDRTTLTANLKPLERRGFVQLEVDKADRRGRRLILTDAGRAVLTEALSIWTRVHEELDQLLADGDPAGLRAGLLALA
jgi:DNA-binding MarR family transcriptional regulator